MAVICPTVDPVCKGRSACRHRGKPVRHIVYQVRRHPCASGLKALDALHALQFLRLRQVATLPQPLQLRLLLSHLIAGQAEHSQRRTHSVAGRVRRSMVPVEFALQMRCRYTEATNLCFAQTLEECASCLGVALRIDHAVDAIGHLRECLFLRFVRRIGSRTDVPTLERRHRCRAAGLAVVGAHGRKLHRFQAIGQGQIVVLDTEIGGRLLSPELEEGVCCSRPVPARRQRCPPSPLQHRAGLSGLRVDRCGAYTARQGSRLDCRMSLGAA